MIDFDYMTNDQKNIVTPGVLSSGVLSPEVLMLMSRQCAYCGPMMQILTELMKQGLLKELHIVNIENNPEMAQQLGVRSVPWLQIGHFELSGSHSKQEIIQWLERAANAAGFTEYLEQLLTEGNIKLANKLIKKHPPALKNVIDLVADPEAKINVRLGAAVIIEDMAESDAFKKVIPQLKGYLSNKDARIRGDACHYLSLTKDNSLLPEIEKLLSDESEEVREIAQDSIDELRN
jgi:thioredoxin-like negative regulator of GroEL